MQTSVVADLKMINELVYIKCGLQMTNLMYNAESAAYGACSFELNGLKIEHRTSKTTPTKTGQFVTIWKRNEEGITMPFDIFDDIDFVLITCRSGDMLGQFIFPKSVLVDEGVLSQSSKGGKRGIRVYPTWDPTQKKQAIKTQSWQTKYFITIMGDNNSDFDTVRQLFNIS